MKVGVVILALMVAGPNVMVGLGLILIVLDCTPTTGRKGLGESGVVLQCAKS